MTASFGPYSATAHTVGSRVVFIDGFGRQTSTFPIGSRVRVRVTDPSRNSPGSRDTTSITLVACQSDQEYIQLTETRLQHGSLRGRIPEPAAEPRERRRHSPRRGALRHPGVLSEPQQSDLDGGQGHVHGREVLFVDAQGQPASVFLEGTRAYLRVVDPGQERLGDGGGRERRSFRVTWSGDAPGDGGGLGRLHGLDRAALLFQGVLQNGILETSQAPGPPHEFETLRARLPGPVGRRLGHGLDAELPGVVHRRLRGGGDAATPRARGYTCGWRITTSTIRAGSTGWA